jgi:hypothetical protein
MWREQIRSAIEEAHSPGEETDLQNQLVVKDEDFEAAEGEGPGKGIEASVEYNDKGTSPVIPSEGFVAAPSTLDPKPSRPDPGIGGRDPSTQNEELKSEDTEHTSTSVQTGTGGELSGVLTSPNPPPERLADTSPDQSTSREASNSLAFPSSPETPTKQMQSRPSIPHSLSDNPQPPASSGSVSSSMTRSNSDVESAKKDKRKRLSSIGGLVRRVSEQGRTMVRSNSSGKVGDLADIAQESPSSGETSSRSKRFSLKAKSKQ